MNWDGRCWWDVTHTHTYDMEIEGDEGGEVKAQRRLLGGSGDCI